MNLVIAGIGVLIAFVTVLHTLGLLSSFHRKAEQPAPIPAKPLVESPTNRQPSAALPDKVPPPAVTPQPRTLPATTALMINSVPQGAEAYLDWRPLGRTPLRAERSSLRGLLVLVSHGHRAAVVRLDQPADLQPITLSPEAVGAPAKLILVDPRQSSPETLASLRQQLAEKGVGVVGPSESDEFLREFGRAGGLSNPALREWARAALGADIVVLADIRINRRDLGEQDSGYRGVREAIRGVSRTELRIALQAVRLKSGEPLTALSATGVGMALDPEQGFVKALEEAVEKCAGTLANRLRT